MIGSLRGRLLRKSLPAVIVEAGGVGYELQVSLATYEQLPDEGSEAFLEVLTVLRAESLQLFGFASREEKALFATLNSVSGIGPRLATALLSSLAVGEIVRAVTEERPAALERVPGIGRKTAQRIVLELKDRLKSWPARGAVAAPPVAKAGAERDDALAALENLGYRRAEAERAVDDALRAGPATDLSAVLRAALRRLGTRP
ncbi:MAG: Holliday junction branch migration protein RuvA [Acidobacteria bacterium]|nr:Holliday junction branch migration protein RuvA [Acidobacteriota bacterium]